MNPSPFSFALLLLLGIFVGFMSPLIYDYIYWLLVKRELDRALEIADDILKTIEEISNV